MEQPATPTAQQRIDFPSMLENISLVEKLVDDVCDGQKVNEDFYGNILIALTEAVNNAIQHGNRRDPEKTISVSVEANDREICFLVADEGPGFNYDELPDPTDPANLEKPHGRGVFLMRNLADEVEFLEEGRIVKLLFQHQN